MGGRYKYTYKYYFTLRLLGNLTNGTRQERIWKGFPSPWMATDCKNQTDRDHEKDEGLKRETQTANRSSIQQNP